MNVCGDISLNVGTRQKVRGSLKSGGFILWEPQNVHAKVEVFQPRPKWSTDGPIDIGIPRAKPLVLIGLLFVH